MAVTVVACSKLASDISAKQIVSGSSDFRFKPYYLPSLSNPVVAADTSGALENEAIPGTNIRVDTFAEALQPSTCESGYDAAFAKKIPAEWLVDPIPNNLAIEDRSQGNAISSALVVEKAYIEILKHYCFSLTAFYDIFNVIEGNAETLDDVDTRLWMRNKNISLDNERFFDYMVSQILDGPDTNGDDVPDDVQIVSRFRENAPPGNERLHGTFLYTKKLVPATGIYETRAYLFRYFYQDVSVDIAPDTTSDVTAPRDNYRWEGYAIATTQLTTQVLGNTQTQESHFVASHVIDYQQERLRPQNLSQDIEPRLLDYDNNLVINTALFGVYDKFGSIELYGEYCLYDPLTVGERSKIQYFLPYWNHCPPVGQGSIWREMINARDHTLEYVNRRREKSTSNHIYQVSGVPLQDRNSSFAEALKSLNDPDIVPRFFLEGLCKLIVPDGDDALFTPEMLKAISNNDPNTYFDFPVIDEQSIQGSPRC